MSVKDAVERLNDGLMAKIRKIREDTCIHACYYTDDSKECIPPEENGVPNCKREIERILEIFEAKPADGALRAMEGLKAKIEARIKDCEEAVEDGQGEWGYWIDALRWVYKEMKA